MAKLISGRVQKTSPVNADPNRYTWLNLENAEPDLGAPLVSGSFFTSAANGQRTWSSTITVSGNTANITNLNVTGNTQFSGNVNLGTASSVFLGGGGVGQVLTAGAGNTLTWQSVSTSSISNANSTVNIPASNGNIFANVNGINVLTIGTQGLILNSGGNITNANNIIATTISGTFIGNGAQIDSLNASNLLTGTVSTARLGTGTANNQTYLRGDGTWQLGPLGFTGSRGFTGSQGFTGSASTIPGPTGNTGSIGFTGSASTIAGPTGSQGFTGSAGTSANQSLNTTNNVQFASLGVDTAASGTAGEIRATNNITAFFSSDMTLKENIKPIEEALSKVLQIGGKTFDWTDDYIRDHGGEDGYFVNKHDFGVIAQDVQRVFPLAVRERMDGTLAVDYEKLIALAFQAINELSNKIDDLEKKLPD